MPHLSIPNIIHWTQLLFLLVVAVWLGSLPFVNPVARPTTRASNLPQRLVFLAGLYLLFAPPIAPMLPALNTPLYTVTLPIALAGLVIAICGTAFAIWARFILGSSWSANPSIRQNHELVLRGPYRIVRHPIYTGILAMFLGSALQSGQLRSLLGFIVCAVALLMKVAVEERLMLHQFGEHYLNYRAHVRRLVPFLY
jgi:protein-S-isoprenylcysteine O-methyltransferase Ste14